MGDQYTYTLLLVIIVIVLIHNDRYRQPGPPGTHFGRCIRVVSWLAYCIHCAHHLGSAVLGFLGVIAPLFLSCLLG